MCQLSLAQVLTSSTPSSRGATITTASRASRYRPNKLGNTLCLHRARPLFLWCVVFVSFDERNEFPLVNSNDQVRMKERLKKEQF